MQMPGNFEKLAPTKQVKMCLGFFCINFMTPLVILEWFASLFLVESYNNMATPFQRLPPGAPEIHPQLSP